MSKQKIGLKESIQLLLRGFKTINQFNPNILLYKIGKSIFTALYPFINIYLSALILNELTGTQDKHRLLVLVAITIGANLVCLIIKSFLTRFVESKSALDWWHCQYLLSHKMQEMDFIDTENQEIRDKENQILGHQQGMGFGLSKLIFVSVDQLVVSFTQVVTSITLAVSMFYLAASKPGFAWLNRWWINLLIVAAIVGSIVLSAVLSHRLDQFVSNFSATNNQGNREFNFYLRTFIKRDRQRDVRMYRQDRLAHMRMSISEFDAVRKKGANTETAKTLSTHILNGIIYLFAACKAIGGAFGVGNIVQYVSSVIQFVTGINGLISVITEWQINMPFLKKYFEFLDIPNQKYLGSLNVEKRDDNEYEIEFHDVSFKYPGNDDYALKHLNMKFQIGEKMAVVGENGSGKSTMIKLLCRLYEPTEGKITLNGIDIKKYDYDQYMEIFGIVFQDFALMPFTLGENVASSVKYDQDRVKECLEKAGFSDKLSTWDKGLDTYLYKNFTEEGVQVSGGEAQKIALARALYKNAPFIVLDEPTAALDPISEAEIYAKFNDIVGDKTAVYISHRLSSCRFCSNIVVFDHGELVQHGSHDELVEQDGKYHDLWYAQAQYYQ